MRKRSQVYRCSVCGNIVEIVHGGVGTLVCCNKSMELLQEKVSDQGLEKHVPVIEKTEHGIKVKVGTVPHPMESEHYIEWIEVIAEDKIYHKFLNPGDAPEAEFELQEEVTMVREFCTVHSLWGTKKLGEQ